MSIIAPGELVAEVERLLEQVETLPDPGARALTDAVVAALLELYGAGLERIVQEIAARDDDGDLAEALAGDELVAHLLLLHGLHPVALQDRVVAALAEVRPYLESHGGDVELLEVRDSTVRLRLEGSCSGCPSSAMTLKLAIENAIRKAAPEIDEVIADGAAPAAQPPLLQIEIAGGAGAAPGAWETAPGAPDGEWAMAGSLPELAAGGSLIKPVAGRPILFLRVADEHYAYRPQCAACEAALDSAVLHLTQLTCLGCGSSYDIARAGRCLDSPQLHLEPVPLLVGEDGLVRVALAVAA